MQIFHLFISVCYSLMLLLLYTQMHGWLSLLDGNQPTVFDNDVFNWYRYKTHWRRFVSPIISTFFTWWSHVNTQMTRKYVCFTIARCQTLSSKNPDLIGFFKIKPRHLDGLKKTDLGGNTQPWEPPCPPKSAPEQKITQWLSSSKWQGSCNCWANNAITICGSHVLSLALSFFVYTSGPQSFNASIGLPEVKFSSICIPLFNSFITNNFKK